MTGQRLSLTWPALCLAAAIMPVLSLRAPLGVAPLFIFVGLAGVYDCWRFGYAKRIDRPVAMILAAAVVYCAITTFWAIDKTQTLRTSIVLAGEFTAGLCLLAASQAADDRQRLKVLHILALALLVGSLLSLMIRFFPDLPHLLPQGWVRGNWAETMSRGVTIIALLLVPVCWVLWQNRRRTFAVILWLAGAAAISASHSLASKLVLPVSSILVFVFWAKPGVTARATGVMVVLALLASLPLALRIPGPQASYDMAPWLSGSSHHRMTIWHFSAENAAQNPIFGWALDAARVIPGADDPVFYKRNIGNGQSAMVPEPQLPLHPHSAPLQIWLELGLIGITLACALIWRTFELIRGLPPHQVAVTGTALVSGFIIASVSYGIWQSWWQGAMWISASLLTLIRAPGSKPADA
ncbi:MAG: O-antigen ligase family protein [Magnetospirillum sp.]